ncbi:arylsulfatase B-like isoform X2 [Nilaparvata lugens]|nr:arylsulfatase B-like isoform X2 [Nilaparvata lugens]XP_039279284.1 arylsulfatase B-like isoform X2 [Nilaparvata lugens]
MEISILLTILYIVPGSLALSYYNNNPNNQYSRKPVKPPNIIMILADDLGWNDVGFHGSNHIPTPNIDSLAYNGILLNNHYSENLCTPSRAALLTGKYPIRMGMQHGVILEPEPRGLPLTEKLFPEHLEKLGYESHAIGKWHLGYYKKEYTPTHRGFKSHYGFWNGYQDYFKHTVQASFIPYEGYDMRRNDDVDWSGVGRYSTDLFTEESIRLIEGHNTSKPLFLYLAHLAPHAGNYDDPLQAPQHVTQHLAQITDPEQRKYTGMVMKLDESVGRVMTALRRAHMLSNSIVIFLSDNGAATEGLHPNHGSNWPLKGEKYTPWEGGVHTTAMIWSPFLEGKRISTGMMHITDWLPTLYAAAGGNVKSLGTIDGINQWETITKGLKSPRKTILHNIDDTSGYSAIRINDYKYVNGTVLLGFLDNWSGEVKQAPTKRYNVTAVLHCEVSANLVQMGHILPSYEAIISLRNQSKIECGASEVRTPCHPFEAPCIFNIRTDPCEMNNLYDKKNRSFAMKFENEIIKYRAISLPPGNVKTEKAGDPALHNNTWVSWGDLKQ